jgi:hypothetical protein
MSESSLPSKPSQTPKGVSHSANADAIERQSLYDREETLQNLLTEDSLPSLPLPTGKGESQVFAPLLDPKITPEVAQGLAGELEGALEAGEGEGAGQTLATHPEQAKPEDLVILIQALNQCNSNLLARVNELETMLATTQAELTAQQARSPVKQEPDPENQAIQTELLQLKRKVVKLRQQMNAAYEANQTHRTHIQTLQQQLADIQQQHSALQEQHAELQERFQEQSQRLNEAEATSHDLCLRLQRQQQYTLQFKAALKAQMGGHPLPLEAEDANDPQDAPVPMGTQLQSSSDAVELLSKVREIRPWSANPATKPLKPLPQTNLEVTLTEADVRLLRPEPLSGSDSTIEHREQSHGDPKSMDPQPGTLFAQSAAVDGATDGATEGDRPSAPHKTIPQLGLSNVVALNLPHFPPVSELAAEQPDAPRPSSSQADQADESAPPEPQPAGPSPYPALPISFDVKHQLPKWAKFSDAALPEPESVHSEPATAEIAKGDRPEPELASLPPVPPEAPTPEITLDPNLLEQLDAAVKPLLDSVVNAIRNGEAVSPPAEGDGAIAPECELEGEPEAEPGALPAIPPDLHQAEEDLWRDLAKLVNISTDDIIQASLAGDFDAFTAIDFESLRQAEQEGIVQNDGRDGTEPERVAEQGRQGDRPLESTVESTLGTTDPSSAVNAPAAPPYTVQDKAQDGLDLPFAQERSVPTAVPEPQTPPPAPVVYPDRPARKIPSISAIDLPTFPRVAPS